MNIIHQYTKKFIGAIALIVLLSGCSLFDLDVQKDYNRTPKTLDPKIYKTTWEYLKEKSANPANNNGFSRMMDAIIYSEIDTTEYTKPGRTFILLTNASIYHATASNTTAFFNNVRINNARATSWASYSKEFVRNYLKYLIVEGVHDHYTIPASEIITAKTLAPEGYFNTLPANYTMLNFFPDNNPESVMLLRVLNSSPSNTSDYPLQVNNVYNMRTSSILATNGTIHVAGAYLIPMLPL
jgi:hypothetical protein